MKKTGFVLTGLLVASFIILASNFVPKINLSNKSGVDLDIIKYFNINTHETKKIIKIMDCSNEDINVESQSLFNENVKIIDTYMNDTVLYIDMVINNRTNKKSRMIYKYSQKGMSKYFYNHSNKLTVNNNNNKDILYQSVKFNRTIINPYESIYFADPFKNNGLEIYTKRLDFEEAQYNEKSKEPIKIKIFETIDNPKNEEIKCFVYPKGTDVVALAMSNKTTVKNIFSWFEDSYLNENGFLNREVLLCYEKTISFRYGRDVEVVRLAGSKEISHNVIEQFQYGKAVLGLNKTGLINVGESYCNLEIVEQPPAMALCNEYYKNQGLLEYLNSFA